MINYLQVENLTKSYGDLVLFDNISFTIGEGQRIALIGRNGSGKTTLLNILAGKDTADSGTITPRRDLRIAYLEQNPEYAADLTVLEACFRSDNPALRAIAAYEQAVADPAQDGAGRRGGLHLRDDAVPADGIDLPLSQCAHCPTPIHGIGSVQCLRGKSGK